MRKWHRNIVKNGILATIIVSLVVNVLFFMLFSKVVEIKVNVVMAVLMVIATGVTSGLMNYLLIRRKVWYHINNMSKLCKMVFDSVYYNLEGKKEGKEIKAMEKHISYFPSIYYQAKENELILTFKLDGSKYHERFRSIESLLSQMFDCEVVSAQRKHWFIVYTLEKVIENRLYIGKKVIVNDVKTEIPIMNNLSWDYRKNPHALVTGGTRGGKTYILYYLIRTLLQKKAKVKIIDPKRADLYGLKRVIGEENVAYATGLIMKIFREVIEEMGIRYEKLESMPFGADYETLGLSPVFLFFDEFIAFVETIERAEDSKKLMSYLADIVLKGGQAGIYLVFATQRADAKYLTGAIRDNLGLRISVGALEKAGYRMTFGDIEKDLEKFQNYEGHGYIWINGVTSIVREFYSPYMKEDYNPIEDLERIMAR